MHGAARWLRWAAVGPIAVLLRIGCWVVLASACTPAVSTLNQQAGVAGPRRARPCAPGRRQLASRRARHHPRNQAETDLPRQLDRLHRTDKTLNRERSTRGPREVPILDALKGSTRMRFRILGLLAVRDGHG